MCEISHKADFVTRATEVEYFEIAFGVRGLGASGVPPDGRTRLTIASGGPLERTSRRGETQLAGARAVGDNGQFVRGQKLAYDPHSFAAIGVATLFAAPLLRKGRTR
jgi:hypothetical protein